MTEQQHASPSGPRSRADGHLDSWGEIAAHLRRSISTVQRWEKQEGLPVHRIAHSKQGTVYATVEELDRWYDARSQLAPSLPTPSPDARITLGVLPFQNLSGSADQDYFSDGLTEELITHLARLRPDRLAVLARTTAMQYRNTAKDVRTIGAELGAGYLLEGSVRRAGDRVRVSAQLVTTSDGLNQWADTYEQPFTDVLEIQTAIAERVGDSLTFHLLSEQHTAHVQARQAKPEAFDEFLKGRYYWNLRTPEDARRALVYFQRAIELDPGFAAAQAGLADTYLVLGSCFYGGVLPPAEAFPSARTAAEAALRLDPGLAEAYATLGFEQYVFEWNWAAAERSFHRALELNPSNAMGRQWYALCLAGQGRWAEARAEIARARTLDPLALIVNTCAGVIHYFAREYGKAREHCERTLEMNVGFPPARLLLATVHCFAGRHADARREHELFERLVGPTAFGLTLRACHRAVAGEMREAEADLATLRRLAGSQRVFPWQLAMVHACLGAADEAFAALEQAFVERSDVLVFLRVDPHLDRLRGDARFDPMFRRVGLG
jgi:TolB-like protein/Tfp pilus assembly protein PilF